MPPVFNEKCIKCFKCIDMCPGDILRESEEGPVVTYPDECWHCGACMMDCPSGAVHVKLPIPLKPVTRSLRQRE